METRFATASDGIGSDAARRRTCFVVTDDAGGEHLVRTRFEGISSVVVEGAPPSAAVLDEVVEEIGWWSPQVQSVTWGVERRVRPDALPVVRMKLAGLTVGQLTVDAAKVASASIWIAGPDDVVLSCCEIDGEVMVVDGNSRAVAAHQLGIDEVWVAVGDTGELQHETRRWCRDEGIIGVADLAGRVVDGGTHQRVWVDRCQAWLRSHGDDGEELLQADEAAGVPRDEGQRLGHGG